MLLIPLFVVATTAAAFFLGRWTTAEEVRMHYRRKRDRRFRREHLRRDGYHRRWMADMKAGRRTD